MPAEITENWRERRFQRGTSATRVFIITGVADEEAARAALAAVPWSITKDSEHPLDSRLKALEPDILVYAPASRGYRATAQYNRPSGGAQDNDPDDPLDKEPTIFPDFATTSEQFDRDANGNPVVTGALNPFDVNPTREEGSVLLTYTRNESSYDLAKGIAFRNKVNDAAFSFPHVGSVAAGQALCKGMRLGVGFKPSDNYVAVVTQFELNENGFRTRILNQDYYGWYSFGTDKRGKFVTANGKDVSRPVLLRAGGLPYDSSIKVVGEGGQLFSPTSAPPSHLGDSAYYEETDTATFLLYPKYKSISFNGLDLT